MQGGAPRRCFQNRSHVLHGERSTLAPLNDRFADNWEATATGSSWPIAPSSGRFQRRGYTGALRLYAAFADRQQALSRRGLCPLASPHTENPPSLRTTPLAVRQSFARVVQLRRCRSYTRHEPLSHRPSSAVTSPCPRNLMLEIILLTPSRLKSNNGKETIDHLCARRPCSARAPLDRTPRASRL